MKELSIEEKAKRYDEALANAKNTIEVNQAIPDIVECVESLFPELAESRTDERIRKGILHLIGCASEIEWCKANVSIGEVQTWLEKQVSQDDAEDVDILHRFSFYSYKDEPNVLYLSGLYVNEEYRNKGIGTKILEVTDEVAKSLNCYVIRLKTKKGSDAERLYRTHGYNSLATEDKDEIWLEKQGEQKPMPIFRVGETIIAKDGTNIIKEPFHIDKIEDDYYWDGENTILVCNQDEFELVEQKPDDKYKEWYDFIRWFLKQIIDDYTLNPSDDDIHKWGDNILNHARKVLEQNPAWSVEDEDMLYKVTAVINRLCAEGKEYVWSIKTLHKLFYWLKSLKEKYSWKPSDEQMKALENAMSMGAKLDSLYNDLKKLK